MTRYKISNLLLFFFATAMLTALLLSSGGTESLQAAPVFQSGLPTPTHTPTPTATPTLPPDITQSRKIVSHSSATIGDVLTYTVLITKTGGPAPQIVMVDYLKPEMGQISHLTYTGIATAFEYVPQYHALIWLTNLPDGLANVTLTWQVEITGVPPGGILTNTVGILATPQLIYREAVTFIQTPTPTATLTPTVTPTPTATPIPTATASPTNTPLPAIAPNLPRTPTPTIQPTATTTNGWTPPPGWPKVLPETGTR